VHVTTRPGYSSGRPKYSSFETTVGLATQSGSRWHLGKARLYQTLQRLNSTWTSESKLGSRLEQVDFISPRIRFRRLGAWTQLMVGLVGFGVAVPLMVQSGLGLGPWDAFHVGLHHLLDISVGTASIGVGALIVVGSLRLGIRPGSGTLANMVLVGVFIDVILPIVPAASSVPASLLYYAMAILLVGVSTGTYMAARLGNGPRDGLMVGLSQRSGWSVRRVRTLIELTVLAAGWLMGGTIGVGTVVFALTVGPATQVGLQLFGLLPRPATP
jgi:uncharacterized membrane protein YczE